MVNVKILNIFLCLFCVDFEVYFMKVISLHSKERVMSNIMVYDNTALVYSVLYMFVTTDICTVLMFVAKVREKLAQLATERGGIMEKWEDRWEYLQLSTFCFFLGWRCRLKLQPMIP